jgi:hypothetical protein
MLPKNPIVRFPLDTKQSCHPDPELAKGKDLLLHFIVPPLSATNASCQAATAPCLMSDLWTWEPTNLALKDFATSLPASTPPCIQTEPTTAAFTCAPRGGGSHPRIECHRMARDGARVLIDTSRWRGRPAIRAGVRLTRKRHVLRLRLAGITLRKPPPARRGPALRKQRRPTPSLGGTRPAHHPRPRRPL